MPELWQMSWWMNIPEWKAIKATSTWFETYTPADMTQVNAMATVWKGLIEQPGTKVKILNWTITSWICTFYLTSDWTSWGTANFTDVFFTYAFVNDNTWLYAVKCTMSDIKTLVVTANKQWFNGVTVVWISVLWSQTLNAAPNSTAITAIVFGK